MNKIEKIKLILSNQFPIDEFKFEYLFGDNVLTVDRKWVYPVMRYLKDINQFDFLMDLCGADYPNRRKRFDVVYHLFSSVDFNRLRIKTEVGEGESVESIVSIWRGADWFEREAWDMYGINFSNNPNLRRLLTHHQFVGHPLRKDFEANVQQPCNESLPLHFDVEPGFDTTKVRDGYLGINIGPSHPAMHGTLRLMCELDGEIIVRANSEIGYLHRCFEKMAETHTYNQVIPFTDRLNYCSSPLNNVGYCKTVEKLMGIEIPPRAQAMRIIVSELSRIIDHFVAIGSGGVDLGALTTFFIFFAYREKVYNLFEKLCGSRLTVSMTRVGGMSTDVPEGWFDELLLVCKDIRHGIDDIDKLLTNNKIFIQRTQGVGKISPDEAIAWGYTGPLLRATGFSLDVRKAHPYYGYDHLDFDIPIGSSGDLYDRYLVRMEEMRQSLRIIEQTVRHMPGGDYIIRDKNVVLPEKKDVYGNIEGLMNHFMLVVKGLRPPAGETYDCVEGANGELGFYLVSDGSANPYRLKVRPPCFPIFQSYSHVVRGGLISDAVATVASMNIIAGELDR